MAYTYKQEFIRFMVSNGVLKFGEFTLKEEKGLCLTIIPSLYLVYSAYFI